MAMFQDQEMGLEEGEPVAGSSAPAGTDQLDLEAAEQLIQLSGGGDDGGGSESRSADSVKSCRGKEKEAAAVESRRRSAGRRSPAAAAGGEDDDGDGGEPGGSKGAAESFTCSTAAGVEERDKHDRVVVVESRRGSTADRCPARKDRDGGIHHGEERRRPKFRSLAAIYRGTETRRAAGGGGGEGHADRDPSEGGGERKRKKKQRAAGDVLPADAEAISSHAYVS